MSSAGAVTASASASRLHVAEGGIQPHVAPPEEGGVGVVVVAGHPRPQLARLELAARGADRLHRDLLDEDVRRQQRQAGDRVAGGVHERDRGAVAVADEHRLGRVERRQQRGQHVLGLLVEEGRRARGARRVRAAVAEAREGDDTPAGRLAQGLREAAPQPHRSEPLVQEHERAAIAVAGQVGDLDVEPVDHGHRASLVSGPVCALRRRVRRANMPPVIGDVLWTPPADVRETTEIGRYLNWLRDERGRDLADYDALWRWSVDDLEGFWGSVWDFFGVRAHAPYERVLAARQMPGAEWFPGARLNYAEHALGTDEDADRVAVVARSQTREPIEVTFGELRDQVARARAGLRRLGVGPGDRVVAYLPNIPETLVAFLATASLGATWAACAPEFGARSVLARFGQIEPKVLLAIGGYTYRERPVDRREQVAEIRAGLPTVEHVVHVPYGEQEVPDAVAWDDLLAGPGEPGFEPVRLRPPGLRALLVRHHRAAEGDRARPRRPAHRAPQGRRPGLGPQARRAPAVVLDHRVDDVERAGVRPARARIDRDDRRRPDVAGPLVPVAAGRGDAGELHGREPDLPHGLPQGGPAARPRLRPEQHPRAGLRGLAAAERGLPLRLRAARPRRPVPQRQRRHRHLRRLRLGQLPAARLRRRDLGLLPGRRRQGLRRRRQRGGGRAGRDGHHRADALDARAPVERPRRRALPRLVLRPLPRRLAPGRLDPLHRARELRHHRALRRDAQPRRRAHRHQRALRRRRGAAGGGRQPGRAPRGRRGRRRRAHPLRGAGRRGRARRRAARRGSPARCAQSSPRATCPTRSSRSRPSRAR